MLSSTAVKEMQYNVIVVGTGGTGSFFIKEFCRYASSRKNNMDGITIVLCDGDTVEAKNLSRQNFFSDSVGRNKALDMTQLVQDTYPELDVRAYPHFILKGSDLENIPLPQRGGSSVTVLVGAVDNHYCRLELEKFFKKSRGDVVYIDSANEFSEGQVVYAAKLGGKVLAPCRSYYFPDVVENKGKRVDRMSCTELNAVAPQHIVTNMLAGNLILTAVVDMIDNQQLRRGVTYFDAFKSYVEFIPYKSKAGDVNV